jgi:hypothetical protein
MNPCPSPPSIHPLNRHFTFRCQRLGPLHVLGWLLNWALLHMHLTCEVPIYTHMHLPISSHVRTCRGTLPT